MSMRIKLKAFSGEFVGPIRLRPPAYYRRLKLSRHHHCRRRDFRRSRAGEALAIRSAAVGRDPGLRGEVLAVEGPHDEASALNLMAEPVHRATYARK